MHPSIPHRLALTLALGSTLHGCRPAASQSHTPAAPPVTRTAAPTTAPSSTPPAEPASVPAAPVAITLATGCVRLDLAAWQARTEAASEPQALAAALAEVGLPMPPLRPQEDAWIRHPQVDGVTVREVELSEAPGLERVLEVAMSATGHETWESYRHTAVQVLANDVEGRACLLGSELSKEVFTEERACMPHPVDGEMEGPQQLDFVTLTHATHLAIRQRTQEGACGGYPRASAYQTSLWEVQGDRLVQVFEPFITYYEAHGAEPHELSIEGTVEIRGTELPRVVRTVRRELCDPEGIRDEDGGPCKPSVQVKRWRYRNGQYQDGRPR
jgi:hypothetical protein